MTDVDGRILSGALKITRGADSIGLPVFSRPGGNALYVPDMDPFFKIAAFLDLSQREAYLIDRNLGSAWLGKRYIVGDPAPIPYWLNEHCFVIDGDAEEWDVVREHGDEALTNDVLRDLRRCLDDARNGVFLEERERWEAQEIASSFHDIFHEVPIHSSYWIRRLNDAVRFARARTVPPHPVDDDLRRISLDWIERFASKTDYHRIMSVIGSLLEGAISPKRAEAMVFGFLINKVASGNFREFEKLLRKDKRFSRLFPQGIYRYWWENNWPRLTFKYEKPYDILDPLLAEIRQGEEKINFNRAERMSYLYFGRENAPLAVHDAIVPLMKEYKNQLDAAYHRADEIIGNPLNASQWESAASRVLYYYYILMSLDGIIDGTHRLSRVIIRERFGLSSTYVKDLAKIAGLSLK